MSYIGNQPPDIGAYGVQSFDGGGTTFTLSKPSTTATVLLFIDGVRQTPVDAYSVSGVTLTTTATTPSGTDNVTVQFLGDVVDFGEPSDDSVATAKIQDDAVTADKLANAINTSIAANTAKVTNATHTGDVTGATALTIATDAVDIAMLSATGTADATTFLRGDNAWATAGGNNVPAFQAYLSSNQTISDDTWTKIECDTEDFDTGSGYDNSSTYLYTVPAGEGGVYWIYFHGDISADANDHFSYAGMDIRINAETNSTASFSNWFSLRGNPGKGLHGWCGGMRTLAAADTIGFFLYGKDEPDSGSFTVNGSARRDNLVGAYKMIGIT